MSGSDKIFWHGTAVALGGRAALIRGPSGAGKSDLALRFLLTEFAGDGARPPRRLVGDDQVELSRRDGAIVIAAPAAIRGLLEVRGVGIVRVECLAAAELVLVVDCADNSAIERLPEPADIDVLGVRVRLALLAPLVASAPFKLLMLLENHHHLGV